MCLTRGFEQASKHVILLEKPKTDEELEWTGISHTVSTRSLVGWLAQDVCWLASVGPEMKYSQLLDYSFKQCIAFYDLYHPTIITALCINYTKVWCLFNNSLCALLGVWELHKMTA